MTIEQKLLETVTNFNNEPNLELNNLLNSLRKSNLVFGDKTKDLMALEPSIFPDSVEGSRMARIKDLNKKHRKKSLFALTIDFASGPLSNVIGPVFNI